MLLSRCFARRCLPLPVNRQLFVGVASWAILACARQDECTPAHSSDAVGDAGSGSIDTLYSQDGSIGAVIWPTMPGMDPQCDPQLCYVYGLCKYESTPTRPGTGDCVRTPASCLSSRACLELGECHLRDGNCVAVGAPDRPCENSFACRVAGRCHADTWGGCRPASDADCLGSDWCRDFGYCHADLGQGACILVASDSDCRRSWGCRWDGQCSRVSEYSCGSTATDDCTASILCAMSGQCTPAASASGCRRTGANASMSCAQSVACTALGLCRSDSTGHCYALLDNDCKTSTGCAVGGQCWASWFLGRCVTMGQLNPDVPW